MATGCQVFGVPLGDPVFANAAHADVLALVTALRRAGVNADMTFGSRGLKGAMKAADRSGARFAALIGPAEKNAGLVQMKDLRNGDQQHVAATSATDWLLGKLTGEETE